MAYNLVRSNGDDIIVVHENSIDNYDTSLQYIGRFSKNYGLSVAQNTLRLLENFASPLSPENNPALNNGNALDGQLWYDSGNHRMMYHKNGNWVEQADVDLINSGNFSASRWNDNLTLQLDGSNGDATGQVSFNGSEGTVSLAANLNSEISSNAASATKLKTARTISLTGNVTGSASFDGSSNISISTSLSITAGDGLALSGNEISIDSNTYSLITESHGWGDHAAEGYAKFGTTNTTVRNNQQLDARYSQSDTVTRLRGTTSGTYTSGDITLAASGATSISQSDGTITISSTDTNTTYGAGTGISLSGGNFSITNIASGSGSSGALYYNGTSRSAGRLYGGTTNPTSSTRLNYDGYMYATRFYTPSSIKLKDIVEVVDHETSLNNVLTIGKYGTRIGYYKADEEKTLTRWLIAEEVAEVSPEAIGYSNGEINSINYDQLIPDLYSTIYNLNQRIVELENKVNK